jgi:lysophospholipase L1-like esterase
VSYGLPTVTGGTAPATTACVPASGSSFNVGSTTVACTATDAVHRAASCTFFVSVSPPAPHLSVTRILAFGDSITEGEVPEPGEFPPVSSSSLIRVREVMPDASYPADLTTLLAQRYTAQGAVRVDAFSFVHSTPTSDESNNCFVNPPVPATTAIVVVNGGCLGAPALNDGNHPTLMNKIAAYNPDLVLLLMGTNDLNSEDPNGSIASGLAGIQQLIQYARSLGIPVMVGTLPPQIAADLTHGGTPELIVPFNNQLRPMAMSAGATVVDLYADLSTNVTAWISPLDGLHPTAAGYQEIAKVWFNAIKTAFETSSSPTPTATTFSPLPLKRHF